MVKAKQLGIRTLTEEEFEAMLAYEAWLSAWYSGGNGRSQSGNRTYSSNEKKADEENQPTEAFF